VEHGQARAARSAGCSAARLLHLVRCAHCSHVPGWYGPLYPLVPRQQAICCRRRSRPSPSCRRRIPSRRRSPAAMAACRSCLQHCREAPAALLFGSRKNRPKLGGLGLPHTPCLAWTRSISASRSTASEAGGAHAHILEPRVLLHLGKVREVQPPRRYAARSPSAPPSRSRPRRPSARPACQSWLLSDR